MSEAEERDPGYPDEQFAYDGGPPEPPVEEDLGSEQPLEHLTVTGPYHGELIITPPYYFCPVHGDIGSESWGLATLAFSFDGVTEHYCLRCCRDWCREHFPQVKAQERTT